MSVNESQLQRLDEILLNFYNKVSDNNSVLPAEKILDLSIFEGVIDDLFLAQVVDGKFKFSFMGKNIVTAYGQAQTTKFLNNTISTAESAVLKKFDNVVKSKKPLLDEGSFNNSDNIIIKYRQQLFPITDIEGGKEVKFIFGGMRWKEY